MEKSNNNNNNNNNNISAGRMTCDLCKSAAALLFCRKDTVFLCMACDTKLHGQTKHERVWMCEVCQQAPASVTCQADTAAMCVTCDRNVHSANPLARRHVRVPVVPFYASAESVVHSTASNLIMMDPVFGYATKEDNNSQLSDDDCCFNFRNDAPANTIFPGPIADHRSNGSCYEFDFNKCVNNICNKKNNQLHCQNVSSLSMDAGVVPQENLLLDVSKPFMQPVNGGRMFYAKDREARVLRYREKRKKRKFEKKIRYASRKAYAEMRPRIKGRFVKRTELMPVLDVDRWWLTAETNSYGFGAGVDYGVAPSF